MRRQKTPRRSDARENARRRGSPCRETFDTTSVNDALVDIYAPDGLEGKEDAPVALSCTAACGPAAKVAFRPWRPALAKEGVVCCVVTYLFSERGCDADVGRGLSSHLLDDG